MSFVLLLCVLMSALGTAWLTHRHRAAVAWDRELDVAFSVGSRREAAAAPGPLRSRFAFWAGPARRDAVATVEA